VAVAALEAPAPRRRSRWRRAIAHAAIGLVAAGAAYVGAVWILGAIPVHADYRPADSGVTIAVASNGVHTDFYLPARHPVKDWTSFAPLESPAAAPAPYVLIGWGDRGFFLDTPTWDDLSATTALAAVFWPTPAVMHVYHRFWLPLEGEACARLQLREAEYRALVAYIEAGFARDEGGAPILIAGRNYTPSDVFYEGTGSYHLLHTCNNWASGALAAAGVRQPLWSPFDGAIFAQLARAR
jgi:uncharacterized protein (TIGR02117 family)